MKVLREGMVNKAYMHVRLYAMSWQKWFDAKIREILLDTGVGRRDTGSDAGKSEFKRPEGAWSAWWIIVVRLISTIRNVSFAISVSSWNYKQGPCLNVDALETIVSLQSTR